MKTNLLALLINTLLTFFSADTMKKFADMILDFVEGHVVGTKSTLDDRLILPLCARVREAFGIADTIHVSDDQTDASIAGDEETYDEREPSAEDNRTDGSDL